MIYTLKHLYYALRSSESEIKNVIENIDSYYRYLQRPKKKYGSNQTEKGSVKYRQLYPSRGKLKRIQQQFNFFLQQNIDFPEYAYGSIHGRNNILNAAIHRNNKHFFSVDMKNFFSYINHHQVFEMFRRNNFSPDVSHILTKLTTYKGGLPQGAPTSPIIANLVFVETGIKLLEIANRNKLTFTSYLDDLEFSSQQDFKFLIPEILLEIKRGGFYINHKKVSYKSINPEITGLFIDRNAQLIVNSIISNRAKENPFTKQYVKRVRTVSKEIQRN